MIHRRTSITAMRLIAIAALAAQPLEAQRVARMELPADLAARSERLRVEGFGGRNEGRYTLGELSGEFTRIESRFAIADPLYAQNRGRSSFTLTGPGFDGTVSAACEMRRETVTIGVITFDPDKMSYHCSFEGALPRPAAFVLAEPKPETFRARMLAMSDRRGEATLGDVTLAISSVHRYADSRIQAPMPVGYVLELDGRAVGAIELTDVDPTILLPTTEPDAVRTAALIAGLALAVLRDPAASALEE
jgi:hypothetical protein